VRAARCARSRSPRAAAAAPSCRAGRRSSRRPSRFCRCRHGRGWRDASAWPTSISCEGPSARPYGVQWRDVVGALSALCNQLGIARHGIRRGGQLGSGKHGGSLARRRPASWRAPASPPTGARSKLARLAENQKIGWDYEKAGIVATVAPERDLRAGRAAFPAGWAIRFLPLSGRQSKHCLE